MSSLLELLLKSSNPNSIADFFLALIIILFFVSIWCRKTGTLPSYVIHSPTLFTSLGVLGTFMGIIIGLLNFNTDNIDSSIGLLLSGLKIAFMSSLVGMSSSILFKLLGAFSYLNKIEPPEIGADDINKSINEQSTLINKSNAIQLILIKELRVFFKKNNFNHELIYKSSKNQEDIITDLKHTIIKENNSKMKSINDLSIAQQESFKIFYKELWPKLENFPTTMSKSVTKEVVKSLKNIVSDFNDNLFDQFGDNFKALDESVKKLVEWQKNYQQQIDRMIDQYNEGLSAINHSKDSLIIISQESAEIPKSMKGLKKIIESNQKQIETLSSHLVVFKDIRDDAIDAFPTIKEQVKDMTNNIEQSIGDVTKQFIDSTKRFNKIAIETNKNLSLSSSEIKNQTTKIRKNLELKTEELNTRISEMSEKIITNANKTEKSLSTVTKGLTDGVNCFNIAIGETNKNLLESSIEIRSQTKNMSNDISKIANKVSENFNDIPITIEKMLEKLLQDKSKEMEAIFQTLELDMKKTSSITNNHIEKRAKHIDDEASKHINNVVLEMGNGLHKITEQFTNDYRELVDQMSSVVNKR